MNQLPLDKKVQIITLLVEGNSLRSTSRITGASINTVTKLLVEVGKTCHEFHDNTVNHVQSKRIQLDEIWAFVYAKEKNVPEQMKGLETKSAGDIWTWTAIDADSKLIVSWLVGQRSLDYAEAFLKDVAERLANRVQLTTDGLKMYLKAVDGSFGSAVDFAQLVKMYGDMGVNPDIRYTSAECTGTKKTVIYGNPDNKHISTSYVERQNLTMRMHMRRFTRLTNGFSKKIENHCYAIALHFVYYNFVRVHKTLRVTPAMEAGLAKRPMTIEDIIGLTKK